ncbi:MAG: carbonate dehydratase, partial [Chthoniobacterales bacterium]|nr:carbonate dehydratase [Chthoniobacterales bacterium]
HGWIYGLQDGLLRDLNISIDNFRGALAIYQQALAALSGAEPGVRA